jgi:hypothetical protein
MSEERTAAQERARAEEAAAKAERTAERLADRERLATEEGEGADLEGAGGLISAAPGLARLATGLAWRSAGWTAGLYVRGARRLLRAATQGEPPTDLLADVGHEVLTQVRALLGVEEIEERVRRVAPETVSSSNNGAAETVESLRERGAALLRQSADVRLEEHAHPAYVRILAELAPDEGRILRLFALEGPQPSVDVRTSSPLPVSSQLVAPGLNMIGAEAGCRYVDRVPAYLNNLYRLGLIWFSREQVQEQRSYQVLEAQPEVIEAMRRGWRTKTIRRSIHLTPFGEDFCQVCLPLHTAELDALPGDTGE